MKKKLLFMIAMVALMFFAPSVSAEEIEVSDGKSLADAVNDAKSNDVIKLTKDISYSGSYLMFDDERVLTLDLNGFSLSAADNESRLIVVNNANLTITGTGNIIHNGHQAVNVWGTENKVTKDYSVLTVTENVTLKGKSGIAVFYDVNNAYGVKVNFAGKVDVTDYGITVNGNIKHEDAPVINILDGAVIKSSDVGLYVAGNSTWTIGNAKVDGVNSAIAIKSGSVTINGGKYTATGDKVEQPLGCNDGIEGSGATIQIETNKGYYGNISLVINDGEFNSKEYSNILEYIYTGDTTAVKKIEINGGTFNVDNETVITTSNSDFALKFAQFISGGEFTGDVSALVKAGYRSYLDEKTGMMHVEKVNVPTGEYVLSGKVTAPTGTDLSSVTVQLKQGSKVLQAVELDKDGNYKFENVASGVYNVVAVNLFNSKTLFVNVSDDTTCDIELDINSRIVIVGSDSFDVSVDAIDKIPNATDVVIMVGKVNENDNEDSDEVLDAIKDTVKADEYDFLDIYVYNSDNVIEDTEKALMFAIPYDFSNKDNIKVSRYHDGEVNEFAALDEMPAEYVDGTFFADKENGMLYVFCSKFSIYALSYDVVNVPQTGDNVLIYVSIALLSMISVVGVTIYTKKKLYN